MPQSKEKKNTTSTGNETNRKRRADCFPTMRHTQQTLLYTKLPPLLVLSKATAAAAAEAAPAMNNAKNRRTAKASRNLSNSTKNVANRSMETPSRCEQLNGDANKTRSHFSQRFSSYLHCAATVRGKKKNERRMDQRLGYPVLWQTYSEDTQIRVESETAVTAHIPAFKTSFHWLFTRQTIQRGTNPDPLL